MITEDYVSFEIAKLLKEKGFNENTNCQYPVGGIYIGEVGEYNITDRSRNPEKYIPAPTIQMAMKWLREVHRLDIDISIEYIPKKVYFYSIFKKTVIRDIDCLHSETNFKSYEKTCSAAIKYCLENLI